MEVCHPGKMIGYVCPLPPFIQAKDLWHTWPICLVCFLACKIGQWGCLGNSVKSVHSGDSGYQVGNLIHLWIKGLIGGHEKKQRDQKRPCRYLSEGDDSSAQVKYHGWRPQDMSNYATMLMMAPTEISCAWL